MRDSLACCFPPHLGSRRCARRLFFLQGKRDGLFSCMVGSGLPELKQEKYVSFIRYGMPNIVAFKRLPDILFLSL